MTILAVFVVLLKHDNLAVLVNYGSQRLPEVGWVKFWAQQPLKGPGKMRPKCPARPFRLKGHSIVSRKIYFTVEFIQTIHVYCLIFSIFTNK